MQSSSHNKQAPCVQFKGEKPHVEITKDIADDIRLNFRALPIFEKQLSEYVFKKQTSLEANEYLKCKWQEYKDSVSTRVLAPFQFVDLRDYHFYKCKNRFIPTESIHRKTDFRYKLRCGPGVDDIGELPIPSDRLMKRSDNPESRKWPKKYPIKNEEEGDKESRPDEIEDL